MLHKSMTEKPFSGNTSQRENTVLLNSLQLGLRLILQLYNYNNQKMKTKKQILESIKKGLTIIIAVGIGAITLVTMVSVATASDGYTSRTAELQAAFDASRLTHCVNHKSLALSKLEDELEGLGKLSDERRNELHAAANKDCSGK